MTTANSAEVADGFLAAQKARAAARDLLDAPDEARPAVLGRPAPSSAGSGCTSTRSTAGPASGCPSSSSSSRQLGRAVAPGPVRADRGRLGRCSPRCGTDEQKARLLPGSDRRQSSTAAVGFGGDVSVSGGVATGDAGVVLGARSGRPAAGHRRRRRAADRPDGATACRWRRRRSLDPTRRSGAGGARRRRRCRRILLGAAADALACARTLFAAEAVGGAPDCVDTAVEYAKVREQFGRTIATFQAIKHHCANMLVAAESATALVWDAARAAEDDQRAVPAASPRPQRRWRFRAYVRNAELNIQVHGGIGFTWEHDAHLHLRRALTVRAVLGGDGPAADVFDLTAAGVHPGQQPRPAARGRGAARRDPRRRRRDRRRWTSSAQLDELIATGYVMPHWPKPWGRAADARRAAGDRAGIPRRRDQAARLRHHRLGDPDPDPARNPFADRDDSSTRRCARKRSGASCSPSPTPARTRRPSRPGPPASTAAGRSTGRRCGPAARTTASAVWPPCAPTPTCPSTPASPR